MSGWRREHLSSRQVFPYLMAVAVFFLLIPARYTNVLDSLVARLMSPFSGGSHALSVPIRDRLREPGPSAVPAGDHKKLEAAYRQLQTELANLHESKLALEKHIHRLTRLRGHFGPKPIFISAGVVGSDSSILRDIKRLAHNGGDYLKTGQMAVADVADGKAEDGSRKAAVEPAAGAVVGRIIGQPGKRTADLQLLSDREFQLPVIIKPHPLRKESWSVTGLLKGRGAGQISVIRVPTEYAVRPGDLVIARADPKYLPAALMVGTVGDCRRYEKNLVLWDIRVKPAADPRTLQDVIIIRPD